MGKDCTQLGQGALHCFGFLDHSSCSSLGKEALATELNEKCCWAWGDSLLSFSGLGFAMSSLAIYLFCLIEVKGGKVSLCSRFPAVLLILSFFLYYFTRSFCTLREAAMKLKSFAGYGAPRNQGALLCPGFWFLGYVCLFISLLDYLLWGENQDYSLISHGFLFMFFSCSVSLGGLTLMLFPPSPHLILHSSFGFVRVHAS